MLKNIGIEKGKPFKPSQDQVKLLVEAERVGYLMAINNSFIKRFDGAQYYPRTVPGKCSIFELFDVGIDNGTSVDRKSYTSPFKFSDTLNWMRFDLKSD